jgi:predicted PurR-regulated permease PerM
MLLTIFGGILFAILISNAADMVSKRTGFNRGCCLAVMLISVMLILAFGGFFLASDVMDQAQEFLTDFPKYAFALAEFVKRQPGGEVIVSHLSGLGEDAITHIASVSGSKVLYAAVDIVIVLFIGIYVAIEPHVYTSGIAALFSPPKRSRARQVMHEASTTLFWWLVGRIASMAVVGLLVGIGLWILGVPLALGLGIWAGLITFIPNIGPILSTGATAIVALEAGGPWLMFYAVLLHFGVQIVESYLITPLIQRSAIAMPPALTLGAQAVVGSLFGIIGLALATPLVALGIVLLRQIYIGDYLGDASAKRGIGAGEP